MKRAKYVDELKQAIIDSIENRWRIWANDPETEEVNDCSLCDLRDGIFCDCYDKPTCCPINDFDWDDCNNNIICCKEWEKFRNAKTTRGQKSAALAMIKRLESIDVEAWADEMVKNGFVKPD